MVLKRGSEQQCKSSNQCQAVKCSCHDWNIFCQFLSISVNFCPFLSISVSFCQFQSFFVRFCLFLSVSVRFFLILSVSVICFVIFIQFLSATFRVSLFLSISICSCPCLLVSFGFCQFMSKSVCLEIFRNQCHYPNTPRNLVSLVCKLIFSIYFFLSKY